ncbi:transglycosylase domain-containing protein [Prevotella sp. KH2C16]|uniref:transglycosylase domain-containing protein n=1 Tax=Prevotella sp. KH2C16 TaxID=1855325 RepID=UPI0008E936F8|nr:transglycosylase domain-containing protein [Prevotella sp. KH2C16]SFG09545.1 penicillin-binding protein 1A [Prevotella sp. KH2C16]
MWNRIKNIFNWCKRITKAFYRWYKSLYKDAPCWKKTIVAVTSLLVLFILYLGAVDLNLFWLFGKSPGYFSGIKDPQTSQASVIYSADGKQIGKYFNENRTPITYEEINPAFFKALVDTEDERFYSHWGIDPIGLFAAAKDALLHHGGRGASTITQQLAKNMFRVRTQYSTGLLGKIPGLKILIMKSKEWIIATKLETVFSKKEIITMYANTVDFGSNAYGIKTAAKTYFNCSPKELTTDQAAILVGMLKATTYYNPKTHPENSIKRRNVVLNNMLIHGDLSQDEYSRLSRLPIKLDYTVENNYDGQALYFREAVADYLKDWCEENGYDLYSSGLKIYTTIDTRMQKYAEDAARKQMKQVQQNFNNHWGIYRKQDSNWLRQEPWQDENHQVIPNFIQGIAEKQPFYKTLLAKYPNTPDSVAYYYKEWVHPVKVFDYEKGEITKMMTSEDSIKYMTTFMHCAMIAMESETGHVKAWVGDIDFKHWKYDKATAMRQPGSTFKLFVYTEAMNQGLTPCDKRRDEYISMDVYDKKKHEMTRWTPSNANGYFTGDSMALKSAFARSINSVAVRLGQEMGIKRIIETAYKMGIKSPLEDAPSLALGSSDVNLLEMVNAYCTAADDGKHHDPVLVTRILDKDGNEVYVGPNTTEQAIPYKSAFLVQQLLQGGMREPGGTSQSLWGYIGNVRDTEFGGKTGTSNNHSDAWFMGVSPKLVVGAWVGGEYRSIHFRTGALGQGSRTALPICGYFLQSVFGDPAFEKYHGKFTRPTDGGITRDMYECASYYPPVKKDTTHKDSLEVVTEEIILDKNGNPIEKPATTEGEKKPEQPTESKHRQPTEQVVKFDEL